MKRTFLIIPFIVLMFSLDLTPFLFGIGQILPSTYPSDPGLFSSTSNSAFSLDKIDNIEAEAVSTSKSFENSVLKGKVICIDPGHGGTAEIDSYRVGQTGEREEWVNLRVALFLKGLLEERGAKVVMTRTTDVQVGLEERSEIAKEAKADLFISIHHNATADDQVNFPIIYFHGSANENKAGVSFGKALAKSIRLHMFEEGTPVSLVSDFVIFPKGGTSVLRGTYGIPSVLAEASFFTHVKEEERLKEEEYNRKEAKAYLEAMEKYFCSPPARIHEKREPLLIPPFRVLQEAERMQPEALLWYQDFLEAKALMLEEDRQSLEKAYCLFTRSARSFPDSYVAGECHQHRVFLLEKMGRREEAGLERKRVEAFFVK
jgi:N-acetylmuramoyl-L-alanine amidase